MVMAQLVECPNEKPGTILMQVRVLFLPELIFSADSFMVPLHVQSHASTFVRTLKISNTGSHKIVWTHGNTAHTIRNG